MSTYAGAAVPALTGATDQHYTITPNDRAGRADTSWASTHHRPLLYLAAGLGCAAALLALAYLLAIGLAEPPAVVRAPLGWGSGVAAVLAGGALLGAVMVRAIRDQTRAECAAVQATIHRSVEWGVAEGVSAVRSLDTLRSELQQQLRELEQAIGRRVEAIERRVNDRDDALHGIERWAMQVDRRLTDLQTVPGRPEATIPPQPNGHESVGEDGELTEGVRGYLLGFYDREKDQE